MNRLVVLAELPLGASSDRAVTAAAGTTLTGTKVSCRAC